MYDYMPGSFYTVIARQGRPECLRRCKWRGGEWVWQHRRVVVEASSRARCFTFFFCFSFFHPLTDAVCAHPVLIWLLLPPTLMMMMVVAMMGVAMMVAMMVMMVMMMVVMVIVMRVG